VALNGLAELGIISVHPGIGHIDRPGGPGGRRLLADCLPPKPPQEELDTPDNIAAKL
jgi:hypothetical protein